MKQSIKVNKIESQLEVKESEELKKTVAKELEQQEQTKASLDEILEKHEKRAK
jgi:BioD-like phosphotransacetylase family protein